SQSSRLPSTRLRAVSRENVVSHWVPENRESLRQESRSLSPVPNVDKARGLRQWAEYKSCVRDIHQSAGPLTSAALQQGQPTQNPPPVPRKERASSTSDETLAHRKRRPEPQLRLRSPPMLPRACPAFQSTGMFFDSR